MKQKRLVVSTGLAMFSMFFGSGNLVFPIMVGEMAEGHTWMASIGIILTGVLVPFLGILSMVLYKGDEKDFLGRLGRPAVFWFPLLALSLMGPFGVLARCITVAHGSFKLLVPTMPLPVFSLIACLFLFLACLRKRRIIALLGVILTPLLLASLFAISYLGIGSMPEVPVTGSGIASLKLGIFEGYQTMDLLASFFFSGFVIQHLRSEKSEEASLSLFFQSALIGAGLLAIIYGALVYLGSSFGALIASSPPQEKLGVIAEHVLGSFGAPVVAGAVVLACFTTAVVLTSLFADFFRKEVVKISSPLSLLLTLGIAFGISTLDFNGIQRYLGLILEVTYPALIVLTVANIIHKLWGWRLTKMPVALAVVLKVLTKF
jgi:LIVCS family branched-chain amino acid:cation transporter